MKTNDLDLIHEDVLIDGRMPSFWEHFADMWKPVADIKLHRPKVGMARWDADTQRIKTYYDKALKTLDTEIDQHVQR
ncbi:MAG: hypothetical protein HAW65_02340 [Alphaproteobacteria bacterium]|nr:hypothetical protein [Alphaproteobacteria bacterium]MBE8220130.1 hypothetical protein [Alphaproteobacteria bacterium]